MKQERDRLKYLLKRSFQLSAFLVGPNHSMDLTGPTEAHFVMHLLNIGKHDH